MTRSTRIAGHTLPNEGRIFDGPSRITEGPTSCSCGAESPFLSSDSARQQWHATHKDEVRQARDGAR